MNTKTVGRPRVNRRSFNYRVSRLSIFGPLIGPHWTEIDEYDLDRRAHKPWKQIANKIYRLGSPPMERKMEQGIINDCFGIAGRPPGVGGHPKHCCCMPMCPLCWAYNVSRVAASRMRPFLYMSKEVSIGYFKSGADIASVDSRPALQAAVRSVWDAHFHEFLSFPGERVGGVSVATYWPLEDGNNTVHVRAASAVIVTGKSRSLPGFMTMTPSLVGRLTARVAIYPKAWLKCSPETCAWFLERQPRLRRVSQIGSA